MNSRQFFFRETKTISGSFSRFSSSSNGRGISSCPPWNRSQTNTASAGDLSKPFAPKCVASASLTTSRASTNGTATARVGCSRTGSPNRSTVWLRFLRRLESEEARFRNSAIVIAFGTFKPRQKRSFLTQASQYCSILSLGQPQMTGQTVKQHPALASRKGPKTCPKVTFSTTTAKTTCRRAPPSIDKGNALLFDSPQYAPSHAYQPSQSTRSSFNGQS